MWAWRCPRADPTYSCSCRVAGLVSLGFRGPSQHGHSHRQQRRRPLLQVPSQRSMWKQSLRQWPWLLLHCWLSERPLAAGEKGMGDLLKGLGNPPGALLVSLAEKLNACTWQRGNSVGFVVKVRCAWEEHLHPASIGNLLTTSLGETASFGLAKLS